MLTIYSKENCSACTTAKQLLINNNIEYEYKVLMKDFTLSDFLKVAPPSHKSFPLILDGETYVGGLNELKQFINNNGK